MALKQNADAILNAAHAVDGDLGVKGTGKTNKLQLTAAAIIAGAFVCLMGFLLMLFQWTVQAHEVAIEKRDARSERLVQKHQDVFDKLQGGYQESLKRVWEEVRTERELNRTFQEKQREALSENTRAMQDLSRAIGAVKSGKSGGS